MYHTQHQTNLGSFLECKVVLTFKHGLMLSATSNFLEKEKSIDVIYHFNSTKKEKLKIVSEMQKKIVEKIHYTFVIKIPGKD